MLDVNRATPATSKGGSTAEVSRGAGDKHETAMMKTEACQKTPSWKCFNSPSYLLSSQAFRN